MLHVQAFGQPLAARVWHPLDWLPLDSASGLPGFYYEVSLRSKTHVLDPSFRGSMYWH